MISVWKRKGSWTKLLKWMVWCFGSEASGRGHRSMSGYSKHCSPSGRTSFTSLNNTGTWHMKLNCNFNRAHIFSDSTMGTGSFQGVKRPGRGVDHPTPLSSAQVKERVELYLYSPSVPSWPVLGWTLPLPLPYFPFNLKKNTPPDEEVQNFSRNYVHISSPEWFEV